MPYVLVYNESNSHPFASVDNRAAASDMVAHLAALGHRRIALVTGPLTASDRARRRLAGARACAKRLGLDAVQHIAMSAHRAVLLERPAGHGRHRRPGGARPVRARRHLGMRL
ncbi:hypothetical protein G6F62_014388 [Rhizopus arrhizus]|nr:hypothetical protein G6F62_014388 [Rhizopus arrhizus]